MSNPCPCSSVESKKSNPWKRKADSGLQGLGDKWDVGKE